MKTKDIAAKYGINREEFDHYLKMCHKTYTDNILYLTVDDAKVPAYVEEFKRLQEKRREHQLEREKEERARQLELQKEEEIKKIAMSQMLISSGFSFDGYKIVKYSGYISGDDATQIPRSGIFGSNNGAKLTSALVEIRRQALKELKEAAYDLGCNAVVGVDFDYITLEPETANLSGGTLYEPYIICVTANGNAVVIEKIDEQSEQQRQFQAQQPNYLSDAYDDPFN